jgi:hypothetical protein
VDESAEPVVSDDLVVLARYKVSVLADTGKDRA